MTQKKSQCVYMLRHRDTGRFYIGSTLNFESRRSKWKTDFFYKRLPTKVANTSGSFGDWEFIVIREVGPDIEDPPRALRFWERAATLKAFAEFPNLCLNYSRHWGVPKSTYYLRRQQGKSHEVALIPRDQGYARQVVLVDDAGKPITQAAAAKLLGCKTKTLQKRLRRWRMRRPNMDRVSLAELRH